MWNEVEEQVARSRRRQNIMITVLGVLTLAIWLSIAVLLAT